MKTHYGFTDEAYKALLKSGVTEKDLYKSIVLFDPEKSGEPMSQVNLFYYVDEKGNFNDPPHNIAHKKIAKALFERLPIKEKIAVSEYLESWENGFDDNND